MDVTPRTGSLTASKTGATIAFLIEVGEDGSIFKGVAGSEARRYG